ncbi:MAG: hypothetical protein JXR88_13095 [Clostridia bacterium]|nr:hypothetical protein [Clostridia bacterium]
MLRKAEIKDLPWLNQVLIQGEMYWKENLPYKNQFIQLYTLTENTLSLKDIMIFSDGEVACGFFNICEGELEYFYLDTYLIGSGYGRKMWLSLNEYMTFHQLTEIHFVSSQSLKGFYCHMGAKVTGEEVSHLDHKKIILSYRYTI